MYGVYRESAFVTPLLLVFFVHLVIFTAIVAFLAPLFTVRREMIVRVDNETVKVTKTFTGYLTKLEEQECSAPIYEDCTGDQKNVTILNYPSTSRIIFVQLSFCCPFVLVGIICVYWEVGRCRRVPTNTVAIVTISVMFEILHTLGYIFYPVYLGSEIGFTWKDLNFGFYLELVNIVFVWICISVKIYTGKRKHFKRKYKARRDKFDHVYEARKFIFVEYNQAKKNTILYIPSVRDGDGSYVDNDSIKKFENANNWFDIEKVHDRITQQPDVHEHGQNTQQSVIGEHGQNTQQSVVDEHGQNAQQSVIGENGQNTQQSVIGEHGQNAQQSVIGEHGQNTQQSVIGEHGQNTQQSVIGEHSQNTQQSVIGEHAQNKQQSVVPAHCHNPTVFENSSTKTLGSSETLLCKAGNEQESTCIKALIYKLWCPQLVGIGKDAHSHRHSRINIKTIHHVHSRDVWQRYMKKKEDILKYVADNRIDRLFCPEDFGADIKPVKTDDALKLIPGHNLDNNVDKKINEHYLFHGTDISNIHSIIQKGFDKSTCHRNMLGKGIYFTDHPVKADQYTDVRGLHGEQAACCMILARVLLGNSVITKIRNSDLRSASSAPCKICLNVECVHDSSNKFDSLIFDGGLFREYVIYENQLVYPEYVIYYDRI